MKKVPPASIILTVMWLVPAVIFGGFLHASKLYTGATGTPYSSVAFVVLGVLNLAALAGFWCMRRWSIWLYYLSTILCLIVGTSYYIIHAEKFTNPEQLAGGFAANNVSGLLVFTIAFLPYRLDFKGKSNKILHGIVANAPNREN